MMSTLVLLCINQHTKIEVPSITNSNSKFVLCSKDGSGQTQQVVYCHHVNG